MRNPSRRCNKDWEGVGGKNPNLSKIEVNKLAVLLLIQGTWLVAEAGTGSHRPDPVWPPKSVMTLDIGQRLPPCRIYTISWPSAQPGVRV